RRASEADLASRIDEDDAARRADAIREVLDREARGLLGRGAAAHLLDGGFGEARAKNPLALPGRGRAPRFVVGERARSEDGRISDAAALLAENASGAGGGGEVSMDVPRHCADGSRGERAGWQRTFAKFLPPAASALGRHRLVRRGLEPRASRE